jgi:mannose-6-phosphate isomerase-like protein (cupin superfamily)
MFKTILLGLVVACGSLHAADGVIQNSAEITAALSKAAANRGMKLAPVSIADQHQINVVNRVSPGTPLTHPGNSELHYIIDGAGTLVIGGEIIRPAGAAKGGAGAVIEGGETRHVTKGDVVFVPTGMPHWYKEVEGTITYLEVRFEEAKK